MTTSLMSVLRGGRHHGFLLVVFSIFHLLAPRAVSAQCNSNFSADFIIYNSNFEVNIDLGTSPVNFNQKFYEGLLAAKNALPPDAEVTVSRGSGGIQVYFDNDLLNKVPFAWAETDMTTYIRINPLAMSYSTNIVERLFTRLGAHEGLHMLVGAYDNGQGSTIMGPLSFADVENNSFVQYPTSCDQNRLDQHYQYTPPGADPPPWSPVILDLEGDGLKLSAPSTWFDIDNSGARELIGWTRRLRFDAFLALDLNSNGTIDSGAELFGNATVLSDGPAGRRIATDGFAALRWYDRPAQGGNGDAVIDARDVIYQSLRLWLDFDADGVTDAGELWPLPWLGVVSLDTTAMAVDAVDEHGNRTFLAAPFVQRVWGHDRLRWAYDVYFVGIR